MYIRTALKKLVRATFRDLDPRTGFDLMTPGLILWATIASKPVLDDDRSYSVLADSGLQDQRPERQVARI